MLIPVILLLACIKDHARRLRDDEDGYTTETVLVTAALVALAIVVLAVLTKLVIDKANSIHL